MKKGTDTEILFKELKEITLFNIEKTQKKFFHLSEDQKKWKPTPESWNLLEIFAHLNEYARFYHEVFKNKISKTKFKDPKPTFVSSPLGRSAWKSMRLGRANNIRRKFKAPKNYNPSINPELVLGNDVKEFVNYQEHLLGILDDAKQVNLKKVKVPISISRIVRLRLGDALMFVVYHNQRHMQQALNTLSHPNFPKKK